MWKLVKTELNYLRPWIVAAYSLFILISVIFTKYLTLRFLCTYSYHHLKETYIIIMTVSLVFIFAMLFVEIKESRLRFQAPLPVPIRQIGIARLIAPLAIFVLFLGLAAIYILIPLTKALILWPEVDIVGLYKIYQEPAYVLSGVPRSVIYTIWSIGLWIALIYAIRLFSEWHGRLVLATWLALAIVHGVFINLLNRDLSMWISDYIVTLLGGRLGYIYLLLIALALACVIHFSFMRRRSFIQ